MRKSKAVLYGDGQECIVKELTGFEIDQLFDLAAQTDPTTFDNLLDGHDLTGDILATICSKTRQEMEKQLMSLPVSSWQPLLVAVKEVNPDFFDLARRLKHRAELIANMGRMLGSSFGEQSPTLSPVATTTPGDTGSL